MPFAYPTSIRLGFIYAAAVHSSQWCSVAEHVCCCCCRWVVFSTKQQNIQSNVAYLHGVTAVPDLAALLFDADLRYSVRPTTDLAAGSDNFNNDLGNQQHMSAASLDAQEEGNVIYGQLDNSSTDVVESTSFQNSSGSSDGNGAAAEALLFQGFAQYEFQNLDDLKAVLQLRSHLQLLLQMKVAGLSAEVFEASQSFSKVLLQLLQMSSRQTGNQDLAWLHQQQLEVGADFAAGDHQSADLASEDSEVHSSGASGADKFDL